MAEITKPAAASDNAVPRLAWIAVSLAGVAAYFLGLGLPFLGPDEPRYAQVAREMFERGDVITPTLGGFNWFEKPILLYWLEFLSYTFFGVSEWAARLGPAIFGVATVACLYFVGKTAGSGAAKWFALLGASTIGIVAFSHGASFDIIVTFPITAALAAYYIYETSSRKDGVERVGFLAAFYFFVGVGLLAKGLIGAVFPGAIVAAYHIAIRRMPSRNAWFSTIWGTLLALCAAAVWYGPMFYRHGYEFFNEFIIQHHFQRFSSNKYQHPQPFIFFWWILPLLTLPWLPLLAASIISRIKAWRTREAFENSDLFTFAGIWLLIPLIFFSFSGSKLPGYILPSVPAAVILSSLFLARQGKIGKAGFRAVYVTAFATLAAAACLLVLFMPSFANTDSVKGLLTAANERGFDGEKVVGMYTVSHSAEFYAAGRLVRDTDGKQRRIYSAAEIAAAMGDERVSAVLVIIPLKHLQQLTASPLVHSEVIADNTELAIVQVTKP